MEFMFYVFMIYCFRVVIAIFCKKIIDQFKIEVPWFLKLFKIVSDGLYFKVFLSMSVEAFLEWSICVYLNLSNPIFSTYGETFSFTFSILIFILSFIFLPCSLIYVIT